MSARDNQADVPRQHSSQIYIKNPLEEQSQTHSRKPSFYISSQAIGPVQFQNQMESCMKTINVDSWKNIAQPICQSTTEILRCIDLIKRFSLFTESRFEKLTLSYVQSHQEMENNFNQYKHFMHNEYEKFKQETKNAIELGEKRMEDKVTQLSNEQTNSLTEFIKERIINESTEIKSWAAKETEEKLRALEIRQSASIKSKIQNVVDLFSVPKFIGPNCQFETYSNFVESQIKFNQVCGDKFEESFDGLERSKKNILATAFRFKVQKKQEEERQEMLEQRFNKLSIEMQKLVISTRQALEFEQSSRLLTLQSDLNKEIQHLQMDIKLLQNSNQQTVAESLQLKDYISGMLSQLENKNNKDEELTRKNTKLQPRKTIKSVSQLMKQTTSKVVAAPIQSQKTSSQLIHNFSINAQPSQLLVADNTFVTNEGSQRYTDLQQSVEKPKSPKKEDTTVNQFINTESYDQELQSPFPQISKSAIPQVLYQKIAEEDVLDEVQKTIESRKSQVMNEIKAQFGSKFQQNKSFELEEEEEFEEEISSDSSTEEIKKFDKKLKNVFDRLSKIEQTMFKLITTNPKKRFEYDKILNQKIINGQKVTLAESLETKKRIDYQRTKQPSPNDPNKKMKALSWASLEAKKLQNQALLKEQSEWVKDYKWPQKKDTSQKYPGPEEEQIWLAAKSMKLIPNPSKESTSAQLISDKISFQQNQKQPYDDLKSRGYQTNNTSDQTKKSSQMQKNQEMLKNEYKKRHHARPQTSVQRSVGVKLQLDAPNPKSYQEVFIQSLAGSSQVLIKPNYSSAVRIQSATGISSVD